MSDLKSRLEAKRDAMAYTHQFGATIAADFKAGANEFIPMLVELAEACEMGAFHHNACPWLSGKECCCAKEKVDVALAKLNTFLGDDNG